MVSEGSDVQVVTFKLKDEVFAVNIFEVKEIIRYENITAVPEAEDYFDGIINLRGSIISVVNLAKKIDVPSNEITNDTRIIVVESNNAEIGMRVDEVTRVLKFQRNNIQPPPKVIADKIGDEFIEGVAILNEEPIILLDLAKVLDSGEIKHLAEESKGVKIKPKEESSSEADSKTDVVKKDVVSDKKEVIQDKKNEEKKEVKPEVKKAVKKEVKSEVKSEVKKEVKQETKRGGHEVKTSEKSNNKNVKKAVKKEILKEKKPVKKETEKSKLSLKKTNNKNTAKKKVSDKKELKHSPEGCHFWTMDGRELKNAKELHNYVLTLSEDQFRNFVNEEKNDFYEWLLHAVKDVELADKIKHIKNKKDISKEMLNHLHDHI